MTNGLGESAGAASTEAREIWAWLWARTKNLYPIKAERMVRMDQAPDDLPALCFVQEILDRVSRERERAALERAAKVVEVEALAYAKNEKRCEESGNEYGASADMHAALGCARAAAAVRALLGGE